MDKLHLKDNETLYIEGGAVVRGCARATSAENIESFAKDGGSSSIMNIILQAF